MSKQPIFTGSGVAIVTPFTENNEVNYPLLGELIDFQIENGTDASSSAEPLARLQPPHMRSTPGRFSLRSTTRHTVFR